MSLDPELLAILACPEDKENLIYVAEDEVLYNPRLHKAYDIRNGIPVLLVSNLEKSLMKFTSDIQISELKFS